MRAASTSTSRRMRASSPDRPGWVDGCAGRDGCRGREERDSCFFDDEPHVKRGSAADEHEQDQPTHPRTVAMFIGERERFAAMCRTMTNTGARSSFLHTRRRTPTPRMARQKPPKLASADAFSVHGLRGLARRGDLRRGLVLGRVVGGHQGFCDGTVDVGRRRVGRPQLGRGGRPRAE
jgi:hypothetical protein